MTKQVPRHESISVAQCEGPGGVLWISSDRDDRMWAKIKPRKFPRASNKTQDNHWTKKNIRN